MPDHRFKFGFIGTSCEIALGWKPQNTVNDKSPLVQVMAFGAVRKQAITQCVTQFVDIVMEKGLASNK